MIAYTIISSLLIGFLCVGGIIFWTQLIANGIKKSDDEKKQGDER